MRLSLKLETKLIKKAAICNNGKYKLEIKENIDCSSSRTSGYSQINEIKLSFIWVKKNNSP